MNINAANNQKTIQQIIETGHTNTRDRKTGELGKDDFLNLLITQLRYQDPLKPVDDKEFIAQMAQFSALEQMQNMNSSFSSVKAYSLIGKQVVASITNSNTGETKVVQGEVSSVKTSQGKTYVVVNGEDVSVDRVVEVSDSLGVSRASNISAFTNLIGYNVKGHVYDPQTANIVGVNGKVTAIQKGVYEDYAVMDGVEVEISDINDGVLTTESDYKEKYLKANEGREVSVVVVDREKEQYVGVRAILRKDSYRTTPDGRTVIILDQLHVPVDSIYNVKPVQQKSKEEVLLEQILDKLSQSPEQTEAIDE